MKKLFVVTLSTMLVMAFTTTCQQSKDKPEQSDNEKTEEPITGEETAKVEYTCTMHPEVISDKPGKCPKCGMELVKKEGSHEEMDHMQEDSTKQQ